MATTTKEVEDAPIQQQVPKEEELLQHGTMVIVGFQLDRENAVYYKKLKTPGDKEVGMCVNQAFHGTPRADFLSIRFVRIP